MKENFLETFENSNFCAQLEAQFQLFDKLISDHEVKLQTTDQKVWGSNPYGRAPSITKF